MDDHSAVDAIYRRHCDVLANRIRDDFDSLTDTIAIAYRKQYGGPEHVYAAFELHPDTHAAADEHAHTDAHTDADTDAHQPA